MARARRRAAGLHIQLSKGGCQAAETVPSLLTHISFTRHPVSQGGSRWILKGWALDLERLDIGFLTGWMLDRIRPVTESIKHDETQTHFVFFTRIHCVAAYSHASLRVIQATLLEAQANISHNT